ncbi:MAG: hypothetical protein BWY66_01493 [bacterium ADurb.Bin374]|nr:MAG: hypothetical protein BWY66_01493 [bacterium ADurb.Bin374]
MGDGADRSGENTLTSSKLGFFRVGRWSRDWSGPSCNMDGFNSDACTGSVLPGFDRSPALVFVFVATGPFRIGECFFRDCAEGRLGPVSPVESFLLVPLRRVDAGVGRGVFPEPGFATISGPTSLT